MSALEPSAGDRGDRGDAGLTSNRRRAATAISASAGVLFATAFLIVSGDREPFGGGGFGGFGNGEFTGGGFGGIGFSGGGDALEAELFRELHETTSFPSVDYDVPAAVAHGEHLSTADKAEILNLIIADILQRIETPDAVDSRPTVAIGTMEDVDLPPGFRARVPGWRFRYLVKGAYASFPAVNITFSRFAPEKATHIFEGHVSVSVSNGLDDRENLLWIQHYRVERVNGAWSVAIEFSMGVS